MDDGTSPHVYKTPQDFYCRQYFEVLDLLVGELTRRFDQKFLAAPKALEEVLLTACASQFTITDGISIPEIIVNTYSQDINIEKLKVQLLMLPDLIKTYKSSHDLIHLKVTSLRTLCKIFLALTLSKEMLSEVDALLRLYFTIPITTATAERSFSVLRRIKLIFDLLCLSVH